MTISEEDIKRAMEQYGNLRHQIEGMRAQMQTVFDSIINKYPEIKTQIDEAREELEGNLKHAEATEKRQKALLESMLDQYAKEAPIKDKLYLKTPLLKVTFTRKVKYNAEALDELALTNPTLLDYREDEIGTRIDLNKL